MTPASGALNAAAKPAPAPALIRALRSPSPGFTRKPSGNQESGRPANLNRRTLSPER